MKNIKEYIEKTKRLLYCNATDEYADEYVTYIFSDEDIDNNIDYFEYCMEKELSPYKALLFFHDYLEEGLSVNDLKN